MAVSGINNYRDALYQWQGQQLKATGSGSSSASSAASGLFSGTSMTNQVSAMVELTKYAMDSMGVGENSRVTFSQITKYRQQLQNEFNEEVRKGLAESGISNMADLSYSLDEHGKIIVTGGNQKDRKVAQAWLDANQSYGSNLRTAFKNAGLEGEVNFKLSNTGKMTIINAAESDLQASLDNAPELTKDLREGLKSIGIESSTPIEFVFDETGALQAKGDDENAEAINKWLKEHSELEDYLKKRLDKKDIEAARATVRLNSQGGLQISIKDANIAEMQSLLDQNQDIAQKMASGLSNLGIDKNISFAIQFNDDGTLNIISDHPDKAKLQQFFEDNPELVKKYRKIETLAGIDDARKAMQISPNEMRKRIQIESMAAWWAGSNDASSYFGNFSDGSLSLMAGLNLNI